MKVCVFSVVRCIIFWGLFCPAGLWAVDEGNVYYAGIPPIAGILDSLVLSNEKVEVICGSNVNPHTFDIFPSQLQKLSYAKIFFHTRFPYELKIVNTLTKVESQVVCVDVTSNIHWREGHVHSEHEHSHEYEEDKDLHCWLSPENLKIMASNIYIALIKKNPAGKDTYQMNYKRWLHNFEEVNKKVEEILLPYKGKSFFVYHPAFGYFAESYGMHEICIEKEGKSPSPRQIQLLFEQMQKEGTKVIFIQPQFDWKPAEIIAKAIGGKVEVMNDFERDILKHYLFIAEKISASYK
ncbi:MAG: metal ABC transporter solute-binding protein, Zn/Mn family [Candidatus Hydrogenedens sp.]